MIQIEYKPIQIHQIHQIHMIDHAQNVIKELYFAPIDTSTIQMCTCYIEHH